MSVDDDELLQDFLTEGWECLERLERELVVLEREPGDVARLASIFRCFHTLKGSAGFFGFVKLEALTHAGEALLASLRDGDLRLDSAMTSALLASVDAVRSLLAAIEADRSEGSLEHGALASELTRLASGGPVAAEPGPVATPSPPIDAAPPEALAAHADTTIRVDVTLLDRVMNLVGELVLARNQILDFVPRSKDPAFAVAAERLAVLTSDLQARVLKTRMQPVGQMWNKYPRLVRDLAATCGKRVELRLEGTDTELDRTVIEAIKDPLTHALRNAVDHGIERPYHRAAAGKAEQGRIVLRASHQFGQVLIEIVDDGAGLDVARIRQRAIERGLLTPERAALLGDRDVMQMVFEPGFSTAEEVTRISGRGVGMDVVKTNVELIGGTVALSSERGRGTVLEFRVPLTLAIVPALVVTCAGERFALPQVNVQHLLRLETPEQRAVIEELSGSRFVRHEGRLQPLLDMRHCLSLPPAQESEAVHVVVLQARDHVFGLVVDGMEDLTEIVVKPLGKELDAVRVFSGATIMGDGRVALIVDVMGLAERADLIVAKKDAPADDGPPPTSSATDTLEALLVFEVGQGGRMAVPMSAVTRLETVDRRKVERALGGEVIQHRGEILSIIDVACELGTERASDEMVTTMIVCDHATASFGLLVGRIVDVVEDVIVAQRYAPHDLTRGAAVLQGKVTDLLDLDALARRRFARAGVAS